MKTLFLSFILLKICILPTAKGQEAMNLWKEQCKGTVIDKNQCAGGEGGGRIVCKNLHLSESEQSKKKREDCEKNIKCCRIENVKVGPPGSSTPINSMPK